MGIVDRVVKRVVPKTRKGKWRVVVYGVPVVLLALDMGLVRWWRRVPVGAETTRVTMVNGEGYPDYLGWINDKYGAGVTRENNAAVLLFRLSSIPGATDASPAVIRLRKELGLAEAPPENLLERTFIRSRGSAATTREAHEAADALWAENLRLESAPWQAKESPGAAWVARNEAGLAVLHEAVERPRYFVPAITSSGEVRGAGVGGMYSVVSQTGWNRLGWPMMARAEMRAGAGDWAGFHSDVMDVLRLARLLGQSWSAGDMGFAWDAETAGLRGLAGAASAMPASEAKAWLEALDGLGEVGDFSRALNEEMRFASLDRLALMAAQGPGRTSRGEMEGVAPLVVEARIGPVLRAVWPVHYAAYVQQIGAWYDGLAAAAKAPDWDSQHKVEREKDDARDAQMRGGWWHWSNKWIANEVYWMPSSSRRFQGIAYEGLARMALALRLYHEAHGVYPASLADLRPGLLREVPVDPFSNGSLVYRREKEGFVLYSVGQDRVDDGGRQRGVSDPRGDEVVRVER